MKENNSKKHTLNDFIPLIAIFTVIITFTLIRQFYHGFDIMLAMRDFMGSFFLIFGILKIINWKEFVEAYATYDIITKQMRWYGYLYPLLEVGLGISYFINWQPILTNWVTLILMIVSSIGVAIEMSKKKTIVCACLGAVFKIPLTWVTLIEDLLMAVMALAMLIILYSH